jgi:hypothetical protein
MATEREYLISIGLAKEGRGRFSSAGNDAIKAAKKSGMSFDKTAAEIVKEERKLKIASRTISAPVVRERRPRQDEYDAKVVRAWAERNGLIEKGRRGKLPTTILNSYLADKSTKVAESKVPTQRIRSKRSVVRSETVGWTFAKRGPKDAAYISEPLVAVTTCGGCAKGVSYCGCTAGPKAPKYLGGELLLLTRP